MTDFPKICDPTQQTQDVAATLQSCHFEVAMLRNQLAMLQQRCFRNVARDMLQQRCYNICFYESIWRCERYVAATLLQHFICNFALLQRCNNCLNLCYGDFHMQHFGNVITTSGRTLWQRCCNILCLLGNCHQIGIFSLDGYVTYLFVCAELHAITKFFSCVRTSFKFIFVAKYATSNIIISKQTSSSKISSCRPKKNIFLIWAKV